MSERCVWVVEMELRTEPRRWVACYHTTARSRAQGRQTLRGFKEVGGYKFRLAKYVRAKEGR